MEQQEQIWKIIDTYFTDDPYLFIKHQLNSYNLFFEKDIYKIFRENNPIRFVKNSYDESGKQNRLIGEYEFEMYFAGKDGTKLYFGKPVIYDTDEEGKYMYPSEARLRNMTYAMSIHFDIDIDVKIKTGNFENKVYDIEFNDTIKLEKIYLGRFPIMLQSNFCLLNGVNSLVRYNMGECKNDTGGYFIIDGKEKVIISQEKFANNMIIIKDKVNDIYSHSADITSVSEDASKPIRKTSVRIVSSTPRMKKENIVVFVPNVRKPVPLFILMRALGIESDKEILECILTDLELNDNYLEYFVPSIHDAGTIFTQELAIQYIKSLTKGKKVANVLEILSDYFIPHMGEVEFKKKALYLGHMVFSLLKVYLKENAPTDRDNYKYKRVETPGILLHELFKEYYTIMKRNFLLKMDKKYYYKSGFEGMNFMNLINLEYKEYFNERDVEVGFTKAFKGNWGAHSHTKRAGIVQDLNILSFVSALSHKRKINVPLDPTAKVVGPRLLNASQWGFIDPVDSPDGGNIGLHKHLAVSGEITTGYSMFKLLNLLKISDTFKIKLLDEVSYNDIKYLTKLFINGAWCGFIENIKDTYTILKLYKMNGIIPIQTSISWNIKERILEIYTDGGRFTRALFTVVKGKPSYESLSKKDRLSWEELSSGFISKKEDYNRNNNMVYTVKSLYGNKTTEDLQTNKAIVEYLDSSEINTSLIASSFIDIKKNSTHMDIHPSFLFGILGNQVMFPENNPAVRNCYGCGQAKQGVSLYNSNYRNRIDKMGVIINYGQIPLVKSRYTKYITNEEHPNGENVIVAIMCNTGYNVEDAVLLNKGSVDRGLFRTTYFNMYETYEKTESIGDKIVQTRFSNIEKENELDNLKPGMDYSFLDKNGIIKENTIMSDNIVVIGRITETPEEQVKKSDSSIFPKKGQLGFVDKSFITDGEEGYRIAKVRIREQRIPAIGDKFASRCGQKGTVGLIIPECDMPFTQNGVKPDIIINPHAFPSRMTIGQLVEQILGKIGVVNGVFGDCTAFVNQGPKHDIFGKILIQNGYHSSGNEIMYDGASGKQIESSIYVGPTYYMRIKQMVKDKINFRAKGPRTTLTRQTVQGRANDGGLRIGEMETQAIQAHGAAQFIIESMLVRGDDYYMAICNKTGLVAIYNERKNIFASPYLDGPLKYTDAYYTNIESLKLKHITRHGRDFSIVRIPYSFKLLMQELQTMNIQMRIITDDNIEQLESMSYSNNINKLLSIENVDLKNVKQERIKKMQNVKQKPAVLRNIPEGEVETKSPIQQEEQVRKQEFSELKPEDTGALEAKEYNIGDIVYYIEDSKKLREWIIEELDVESDVIVINSQDISELSDDMKVHLSDDRLVIALESEDIRKKSIFEKQQQQKPEESAAQQSTTQESTSQQQQGTNTLIPSVLNETINTAQETINNAQQTIQTAQKRITDNISSALTLSPPYNPATPSSSPYNPKSPSSSPPFTLGSYTPASPPFNPNEGEEDLEGQKTIIKKEGSTTENKDSEDTEDKTVEKVGGGEIMIDSLPTLTNIFNTILKTD